MSSALSGEISDRPSLYSSARSQSRYGQFSNNLVRLLRISDLKSAWSLEISIYLALSVAVLAVLAPFDETFSRMILASDNPVKGVMAASSDIGLSQVYLVPSAIVLLFCAIIYRTSNDKEVRGRASHYYYQALHVLISVAVSGLLVDVLKICIGRARPKLIDIHGAWYFSPWSFGYDFASMPSGHAATVGAVVAVLMIWLPGWRPLILALGFVAAATRFAVAAHYISDVLAGFTIGYVYSLWLGRWLAIGVLGLTLKQGSIYPSAKLQLRSGV